MGYNEQALSTEYVGVRQFWAVVGGKRHYWKSNYEYRWAQYLEILKVAGEIIDWEYEPTRFYFAEIKSGTKIYKPDFKVYLRGTLNYHIWHECKGHLHQKNLTQFHRMQIYYPNQRIILVMQNIPKSATKKNLTKRVGLKKAAQFVERIMDGGELLKKAGL